MQPTVQGPLKMRSLKFLEVFIETIIVEVNEVKHFAVISDEFQGQDYDGSVSIDDVRKGASNAVLEKYSLATNIHCCCHILNLTIASSCSELLVRNMMGSVSKVSTFFQHGEGHDKLAEVIHHEFPDVNKK